MSVDVDSVNKCGELFVTNNADKWTFFCSFCQKVSSDIGVFICHVRWEHLNDQPRIIQQQPEIHRTTVESTNVSTNITSSVQKLADITQPPVPAIQSASELFQEEGQILDPQHLVQSDIYNNEDTIARNENAEETICSKVTKIVDITLNQPERKEMGKLTPKQNSLCTTNPTSCKIKDEFFTITLLDEDSLDRQQPIVQIHGANINSEYPENITDSNTISCHSPNYDNDIEIVDDDYDIEPKAVAGISRSRKYTRVKHKCIYCQKCFKKRQSMIQHIGIIHGQEMPYKCTKCDRGFNSKSGLRMHKRYHDEKCVFKCPVCKSKHMDYYFIGHVLTHESDTCFPCQVCGKIHDTDEARMQHWKTHAKEMPYACSFCYRRFRKHHFLIHHLKSHNQYICNFCPAKFNSTEFQRPPYICPKCEKLPDIKEKAEYQRTLGDKSHTYESDEESNQERNELLKDDLQNVHSTIQNEEIGDNCNKKFNLNYVNCESEFIDATSGNDNPETSRSKLLKIMKTNNRKKIHTCAFCSKIFFSKQILSAHINNFHDQSSHQRFRYKCRYCKKGFNSKSGLSYHQTKNHDISKAYKCSVCSATVFKLSNFITHVSQHESNTCFPCQVCGKVLNSEEERASHRETHIKERPHGCNFCYRRFYHRHFLIQHMRKHGEYVCNKCKRQFNSPIIIHSPYTCSKCEK